MPEPGPAPATGPDEPDVDLGRRLTAEALGTGLLVTAVIGSGVMASRLSPDDIGLQLLENAAATAAALIGLTVMLRAVSGAHFNPAVTLVGRAFGTISNRDTGLYLAAQIVGGCLGAVVANVMFELPAVRWSTNDRSSGALWLSEVVATVGLLLVIHGCIRSGRANAVPFAVGIWIGGAYWFTSSTSFANPAVTVARTMSDSFTGIEAASAPMFIVMQLVGAALAYGLIRYLYPSPKTGSSTIPPAAASTTSGRSATTSASASNVSSTASTSKRPDRRGRVPARQAVPRMLGAGGRGGRGPPPVWRSSAHW